MADWAAETAAGATPGAPGETVFETAGGAIHALPAGDAVAFFIRRAATDAGVPLDNPDEVARVEEIVRTTGALVPALQAAASLLAVWPVSELAERLHHPAEVLSLPVDDRSTTLGQGLGSWLEALPGRTRQAAVRLSHLPGGFPASAAEALLGDDSDLVTSMTDLSSLVASGAIMRGRTPAGEFWFTWRNPLRLTAAASHGAAENIDILRRQARWIEDYAAGVRPGDEVLEHLLPNVWATVEGLSTGDTRAAIRLIVVLLPLWRHQAGAEARRALDRLLGVPAATHFEGIRDGLVVSAELAIQEGDYAAAGNRLGAALVMAETAGDRPAVAAIYGWKGLVAFLSGDLAEAQRLGTAAVEIYREVGDQGAMADRLVALGRLAGLRGDRTTAGFLYRQALAMFRSMDAIAGVATCLERLGQLARVDARPTESRPLLVEALDLRRRLGEPRALAATLVELARLSMESEDLRAAEALYEEAGQIFSSVGDRRGMAKVQNSLGRLDYLRGDHPTSQHHYGAALKVYEQLGDRRGQGIAKAGLAHAVFLRPVDANLPLALALGREALVDLKEVGDYRGAAWAAYTVAEVGRDLQDYEVARQGAEECLALYRRAGDEVWAGLAIFNLAELARVEGDLDRTEALARDALSRARQPGSQLQIARCLEVLAGVESARGNDIRGAVMHGAAADLRRARGLMIPRAAVAGRIAADLATLEARLGDRLSDWMELGASLTLEEAALVGLGGPLPRHPEMIDPAGVPAAIVRLLGEFRVELDGAGHALGPGTERKVLCALALSKTMHVEQLVDLLWDDVDVAAGRRRLKTVMSRIRSKVGPVVVRSGELWSLAEGTVVDVDTFLAGAKRALADRRTGKDGAAALCRQALDWYGGEFLPAERYEDWAVTWRLKIQTTYVDLLDALAASAMEDARAGDAADWLERAISADPLDIDRYVRAARMLLDRGWRSRAVSIIRQAEHAVRDLGVPEPPSLTAVRSEIAS